MSLINRLMVIGALLIAVVVVSAVFPEVLYVVHLLIFGREGGP